MHRSLIDGEGCRITYLFHGCSFDCKGCPYKFNDPRPVLLDVIILRMNREGIVNIVNGFTLSGGDPFLQPEAGAILLEEAHKIGWDTWTYSCHTYEELLEMAKTDENVDRMLKATDVLVDGRYMEELADINLKYRDSSNQRIMRLVNGVMTEILDYDNKE